MSDYQVIARKFRPQTFNHVLGQDAIITTLKNAIKNKKLAQAYLFCGSRGTGKTTLARLLAKALNCAQPRENLDPCNECEFCKGITSGHSLDVLEIDGASHRGIEDIRQINETVAYAAASGHYKIYIIDEVHMLTKEAFNALLKTLEEPPEKVKFFFATTEPHKIPPTILSRCQRFNLKRIPLDQIIAKLRFVAKELNVEVEDEAFELLAQRAEGGLRDAESLFDQILAFEQGKITIDSVSSILGITSREVFFEMDLAGEQGELVKAFEIADRIFSEGKDLNHFLEGLINHLRQILLFKLSKGQSLLSHISEKDLKRYAESSQYYTQEQCLNLIEYLLEAQLKLKHSSFVQIALENILLHVMRSHFSIPIEYLVRRLNELEESLQPPSPQEGNTNINTQPKQQERNTPQEPVKEFKKNVTKDSTDVCVSEDPTPSPTDLGHSFQKTSKKIDASKSKNIESTPIKSVQINDNDPDLVQPDNSKTTTSEQKVDKQQSPAHKYDTLIQFAAIELEGNLQKTH